MKDEFAEQIRGEGASRWIQPDADTAAQPGCGRWAAGEAMSVGRPVRAVRPTKGLDFILYPPAGKEARDGFEDCSGVVQLAC